MKGIGPILRQVRTERDITLAQIEEATKIRTKYLQAIEDENFELLPGEVYAKGFINTYVRYLNIGDRADVKEILHPVKQVVVIPEEEEPVVQSVQKPRHGRATQKRIEDKPITSKKYLIIGLSALAIAMLLGVQLVYSHFMKQSDEDDIIQPPVISDDLDNEGENTPPVETKPIVEYEGLNLEIQIVDANPAVVDKCWVEVSADGVVQLSETLSEGAIKTVTAQNQIKVKLGNGGAVKLILNGEDLGVAGESGQVVRKEFTLDAVENAGNTQNAVGKVENTTN